MKQMGCTQPTYSTAGENNVLYLIAPSARWPQVISFLLATIAIGACSAGGAPPAAPQTWYLAIEEQPASSTLQIFANGTEGTLVDDAGVLHAVDSIRGGSADGPFDFREIGSSGDSWFQGTILDGVVFGRFAQKNGDQLPATSDFTNHFTGWNRATYEQSLTPRVFDLLLDGTERVTLRFDSAPAGNPKQFVGSIKSYATIAFGIKSEKEQLDVDGVTWDGRNLQFGCALPDGTSRAFIGTVDGRTVRGSYLASADPNVLHEWHGTRSEILSYGLQEKSVADRSAWQARTRGILRALMMGGAPEASTPISMKASVLSSRVPFPLYVAPVDRDDNINGHPQDYGLQEVAFDVVYRNPYSRTEPFHRAMHGWLAIPNGPPPPGGFPAVVAVNGHTGGALQCMDPNNGDFWYGDSFARRNMVVLAVDISHRPVSDRQLLYTDIPDGDDPYDGNHAHPAIKAAGFDSDWEEDGERSADASRGREYLASMPNVNAHQIGITGLSMGGTITTEAAALDPAFTYAVPAGFSPDLAMMDVNANHPCWKWQHGHVLDYIEASDMHALIAPRPLIVETGKIDTVYSLLRTPYSGDKQVARRSRVAYGQDVNNFVHYLHYDQHHFHVGGIDPTKQIAINVQSPVLIKPDPTDRLTWQIDGNTAPAGDDLFAVLDSLVPP